MPRVRTARHESAVVDGVSVNADADLPQVATAGSQPRRRPRCAQGAQKNGRQQRYHGEHDQQLHQGEAVVLAGQSRAHQKPRIRSGVSRTAGTLPDEP